jgi:hypothetical protein
MITGSNTGFARKTQPDPATPDTKIQNKQI